ncbi:MAG: hypothetical protein WBP16_01705 [Ferruginibacter sp.]
MLYQLKPSAYRFFFTLLICGLVSCNQKPKEDDAVKLNETGLEQMDEGKYEQAVASFKEALQKPRLSQISRGTIYRNLSLAYHEQSMIDSSFHYSSIAAKCYPKNSYYYLVNMAAVDILAGRVGIARSKLKNAFSINSDDLIVNNSLGLIYLGDYGEEFTDLTKALKYNKRAYEISGSLITEDILGRTYYELGEYENAEIHYENVYHKKPESVVYALTTGMIKYKLDKQEDGELLFEKVIAMDSSYKATIENFKVNNR